MGEIHLMFSAPMALQLLGDMTYSIYLSYNTIEANANYVLAIVNLIAPAFVTISILFCYQNLKDKVSV